MTTSARRQRKARNSRDRRRRLREGLITIRIELHPGDVGDELITAGWLDEFERGDRARVVEALQQILRGCGWLRPRDGVTW